MCNCRLDIVKGIEDKFWYEITDDCVMCGMCAAACPVNAIATGDGKYEIDSTKCIDCGTCSAVCPMGAARSIQQNRESIDIYTLDYSKCYFNAGCAMSLYKPDLPGLMLGILQEHCGDIKPHTICCRHDPDIPSGSVIINNCAGCDRRFRSLYEGIETISLWEVLDSIEDLDLPDYEGMTVSVHDSCGYRHKPQVHNAIRSLLGKMNINVAESEFSGRSSVCCGDNLYGSVPDEEVEARIRMRADQMPCDNVVVYCIGCVRAMQSGGKTPLYLPELILGRTTAPMPDTLEEYHTNLVDYIEKH